MLTRLARKLSVIDYFSLGWGTMVGVGWLVVMDDWLLRGGPLGGILGFAIGGILLLPIGYVYGKWVMAMPDAAGEVAYTAKVFPRPISFFTGWMMMLAYFIVCPWEAVAVGRIAGSIVPALNRITLYQVSGKPVYLPHLVIGLGLTGLVTLVNYRGIRLSATFQNWTTFGTLALFVIFVGFGVARGSPANFPPLFTHTPFVSILLVLQIVPYYMTGFESVTKAAEEANPDFRSRGFSRVIFSAITVGFVFYIVVIAGVAFVAPWRQLTDAPFMTAVAFQHAVGSRWIVSIIMSAALLSLFKVFNGNFVAASRLLFAMARRGLLDERLASVHPKNQTPASAVLAVGIATGLCMFLGSAILIPISEVGSVASATGWFAVCTAFLWTKSGRMDYLIALLGACVDGRIAAIGNLSAAARKRTIDATGKVVAPGFIDMLGQSETTILVDPRLPSKIYQGITTEITGEGGSAAPLTKEIVAADRPAYAHYKIDVDWQTFRQYFARLEKQGMGINLASYVGATQVRRVVLGDADVQPTPEQLEKMKALVRDAMRDGAVGVSTALEYAPAPYAKTEEIIALAAEASKFGGIYATHMRNESDTVLQSIDEALRIGREAHIPVEIWHIKVAGKHNWGRMPEVVAKINQARAQGSDISADTYAYPAWFNSMSAFVPPWAHDGGDAKLIERLKDPATRARIRKDLEAPSGDWDNEWQEIPGPEAVMIGVVQNQELKKFQGKRLSEAAEAMHKDAMDALFDLLIEDKAFTGCAVFGMSEPDVALALQQPWVSIDNDSSGTSPEGILGEEHPHPRAYGTFPRILRKYVREEKKLTLEEAIRKFSALPAQRMRLTDRGVLKQGMWADVVVFDQETVRDLATFDNPNQLSQGMEFVLVNGVPVIENGKMTGALPGKVLRGAGYQP